MTKEWMHWEGDCAFCGAAVEVLTDTGQHNLAYDGDKARCVGCGEEGQVIVVEEPDNAYIQWNNE